MDGHGQWEVVLYNPFEKQTVLYNRYDHTLRILDGRAYAAHHGPIPMPAPPRRSSIDYVGGVAPVVRQKVELGISPSATPAFPQASAGGAVQASPPGARRYVSPSYFELINLGGSGSPPPMGDDDDLRTDSSDESDLSSSSDEEDDLRSGGFERSLGGEAARQARARRQRTQSLRSRAFNQGYYHKFFDEEACLGRGAFGSVHLCHHVLGEVNLGKYAIKKVPVGNDHPRLAAVLQEVKALERLQHPNIVSYKHSWLERTKPADFGPDNIPTLFILTEYANAGNLHDFIFYNPNRIPESRARAKRASFEKRATLNPLTNTTTARTYFLDSTTVWSFFTDICNGLSHLHHRGIIHCDLKPQNLLLDKCVDAVTQQETTRVLITDFGSVKSLLQGERAPRTGNTGTIAYMAPEALITDTSGRYLYDYNEKSDVWSLGVILYELCFSESPFRNVNSTEDLEREIIGSTRGITEFPSTPVPRPHIFTWLIQWMMQGDPAKRPSVDDILGIPEVMHHNTGTPRPPAPAEAPPPLSTAHLLELPPQIVQTTIPSASSSSSSPSSASASSAATTTTTTSASGGNRSTLFRRRSSQLMPPPLSPARRSSTPSAFSPSMPADDASSTAASPASAALSSATALLHALRLPSPVVAFLAPAVNFCLDNLDAFMRQSLFATTLLIKVRLALCVDMAQSWSSWYIHLMVALSLGTMLLCLPVGRHVARLQWACIIGQWLLAVVWWWQGPSRRHDAYYQGGEGAEGEYSGAGVVWELLVVALIELMLSLVFVTLKLAKTDRTRASLRASRASTQQRSALRTSLGHH
ncbi:protein kinase domain containing protein [Acanthamoeba castellanii str. Neff]|uniref:Protein kinase domain containing protein n=1 Tax=Acanthamoeba castellanii (strain ATCC 30010 / Neff) TaxID=1257118 RepID=L8H625_ACACF|nr:protein kinase domain containing protein [Acanthamoeba castellanii str. Neff]ELR20667.1 protein kinase domain containing protein [Acanthamoeba castellanii str. Neff]